MELKDYKQLILFIIPNIIISAIFFSLVIPEIFMTILMIIGISLLFVFSSLTYYKSMKDALKNAGKTVKYEIRHFIPLIVYIVAGIPIAILLVFILKAGLIIMIGGLILVLVLMCIICYLGMKGVLKD